MSGSRKRWIWFALLPAGLVVGLVAELIPARSVADPPYAVLALDAAVGYAYIVAGLIAWTRSAANRTGPLLLGIGFTWFIGNFRFAPSPVADVALVFRDVTNVLLVYLLLAYPSGRLGSRLHRFAVAAVGVALVGPALLVPLAGTPGLTFMAVPSEPDQASLSAVVGVAFAIGLLGLLGRRWMLASQPARRTLSPVVLGGAVTVAAILSVQLRQLVAVPPDVYEGISWALLVGRVLVPMGFLVGLLRLHMARVAVADLVVRLGDMPAPENLRPALASALGDPSLEVFRWDPATSAFIDPAGGPRILLDDESRAVTILEGAEHPLVAIAHDPALLEDPGLVASVTSAMRLAVENERLHLAVEAQLAEVRASRARIVEAGDAERKRVERNLHDGAQQRLVSLALALRLARTRLGSDVDPGVAQSLEQASDEAKAALAELRELARGIHPQILTEAGLRAAVQSLVDRSPVEVVIDIGAGRYAPAVEGAAYFMVSEALANVAKYAGAQRAIVRAGWLDDQLTVEVVDDGVGGADASRGTGLRGLGDRLASIDGWLEVISPVGGGTRLLARIPSAAPTSAAT